MIASGAIKGWITISSFAFYFDLYHGFNANGGIGLLFL